MDLWHKSTRTPGNNVDIRTAWQLIWKWHRSMPTHICSDREDGFNRRRSLQGRPRLRDERHNLVARVASLIRVVGRRLIVANAPEQLRVAIRSGGGEVHEKGYALPTDQPLPSCGGISSKEERAQRCIAHRHAATDRQIHSAAPDPVDVAPGEVRTSMQLAHVLHGLGTCLDQQPL